MASRLAGAALAAVFALALPALAQQRTLTIGAQTPPSALDPHFHNTTNNTMMLMQIFERLFELDNRAVPQPRLAESMRALDDLTWEVKLRPGVRFHDGTPLEAEDIPYTFARIPTVPNSPALYTPAVRTISAIEIVDATTIRILTREPNPLMRFDMAAPFILSRRIHGQNPATSDFNTGRLAIGTGPYRLVSYSHGERLELARHAEYWGPPEPWERVVVRFIPQAGSRSAALLAGEVDLIDGVPYQDVPKLAADPRVALFGADSITSVYLFPDASREQAPHVA
ncbi:MAG TPA: ABC transporter substrate-binding protein, partial [Acetobacteraceae bacterium]|nr:ABC transporter substrate-binding protein [Acetobacteraceae bacterium]